MRKILFAAAALAALSSAPAFAGEGTFEPATTASGFMSRMMASAHTSMLNGTSFQYNNAGNYGDTYGTVQRGTFSGARIGMGNYSYGMTNGNG